MNTSHISMRKNSLFVILILAGFLTNQTIILGNQEAERSTRNEASPLESTLKKTVNFFIWPLRKTLEFKDKVLGKDKEKQILQNQIMSKKAILHDLKTQLSGYVPGGNVERCAKLLLKKDVLDKQKSILKKILNKKQTKLAAVQGALALLQGPETSGLKKIIVSSGGVIGGALIGYTTVQFISDRLFESGHSQLANLLKEQQMVVQKMQELKALLDQLKGQEEQMTQAKNAEETAEQKTVREQELLKVQNLIEQTTEKWNTLKKAYDILNEKIITPQNSNSLVNIIKTCAPWVGAAIGALIGYKIANKLFIPVAKQLSENEQVQVLELQKVLQEAQTAFDLANGKYSTLANKIQSLENLPTNVRSALSDYLSLQEQVKDAEEYLNKKDIFEVLGL